MFLQQLAAFLAHPRRYPTNLSYINGFAYGIGLNMLMLLVPLYVIELEYSLSELGLVVSASALFMILLRLAGGAVSDRFGERLVIWFSFGTTVAAALVLMFSTTLLPLIVAQLFAGASRSVYWSAGQSYTSRSAEGNAGKVMGRLLSFESTGGILGATAAGAVATFYGFSAAFLLSAAVCSIGIVCTGIMPPLPRVGRARSVRATLAPARRMMVQRSLGMAHLTSFMSAAFAALFGSIIAAYFKDVGYNDATIGGFRSLHGIGVIIVAYPFGAIIAKLGLRNLSTLSLVALGLLTLVVVSAGNMPSAHVGLMLLTGIVFGSLRTLYTVLAAENSVAQERALALAVVGFYWAVAMFIVPWGFGTLGDAIGLREAIYAGGAMLVASGVAAPMLYRVWHRPARRAADSAPSKA